MSETQPRIIFEKCPICKTGKVWLTKEKALFLSSDKIKCDACNVLFNHKGTRDGEDIFKLDLSKSSQSNKYNNQVLKRHEWENGISDLDWCIEHNKLPEATIIGSKIIMQKNEQTHWYSLAILCEERMVRVHHRGGVGFRVMKGVYAGGSKGYSESHPEMREVDQGELYLTNQRLIFNGNFKANSYKLNKIISIEEYKDAVEIGVEGKSKTQTFKLEESQRWVAYIKIAINNFSK